jgi:hypothetical protein
MDSLGSAAQIAGVAALGTAFGGAITRFLVNKWLKDRENFEASVMAELKALSKANSDAREYTDHEVEGLRKHERAARDVLLGHVDAEVKILRDRWHAVDTLTQVWVNNIALMRVEIKSVVEGQVSLERALHEMDKTISRMGPQKT